ncbi:unnamed protein product [marine sediment metagenome]|uniref:Uncharacterized protein n=1 Tax=marine sediment metagenome TaxID=412755 RepID=X0UHP6_9ZZZZ
MSGGISLDMASRPALKKNPAKKLPTHISASHFMWPSPCVVPYAVASWLAFYDDSGGYRDARDLLLARSPSDT